MNSFEKFTISRNYKVDNGLFDNHQIKIFELIDNLIQNIH